MQVADPVAIKLHPVADALREIRTGHGVEQHAAGGPKQRERPARDHYRPDQPDQRIHKNPAECPRYGQSGDRHNRNQRIGKNMNIGRAQIDVAMVRTMLMIRKIVLVMMIMTMIVVVMMRVMMLVAQQPRTDEIDA